MGSKDIKRARCEIPDSWKVLSGDRNGALSLVEGWRKPTNENSAQPRGRCSWLLREVPLQNSCKNCSNLVRPLKKDKNKFHGKDDGDGGDENWDGDGNGY